MNELYPKELISKVTESIDCGLICFINTETFEMEDVPGQLIEDPEEYEALTGTTEEMMDLKHRQWEQVISIEPMDSGESFRIMEDFAQSIIDHRSFGVQARLVRLQATIHGKLCKRAA